MRPTRDIRTTHVYSPRDTYKVRNTNNQTSNIPKNTHIRSRESMSSKPRDRLEDSNVSQGDRSNYTSRSRSREQITVQDHLKVRDFQP